MKYITMYFHIPLLIIIIAITMSFEYKYIYLYSNQHYSSTNIWLQIISLNITIRYITDIIITYFLNHIKLYHLKQEKQLSPLSLLPRKKTFPTASRATVEKMHTYIRISCKSCIKNSDYDLPSPVLSKKDTPFNRTIFSVTM